MEKKYPNSATNLTIRWNFTIQNQKCWQFVTGSCNLFVLLCMDLTLFVLFCIGLGIPFLSHIILALSHKIIHLIYTKLKRKNVAFQFCVKQNFKTNMFWFGTASSIIVHLLATWSVFIHKWNTIKHDYYFRISMGLGRALIYGSPPSPPWSLNYFYEKSIIAVFCFVIVLCSFVSTRMYK